MWVAGLLACAGALATVPAGAAAAAACRNATLQPSGANGAAIDAATLCLIDRLRVANRLAPLRANRELGTVAGSQVSSMISDDYFGDVRPTGQTPMSLIAVSRYRRHTAHISVGQNIAWASALDSTPASIVAAWMASPPHRAIMLDAQYRDAGAAVAAQLPSVLGAGSTGAIYAIEFGARRT